MAVLLLVILRHSVTQQMSVSLTKAKNTRTEQDGPLIDLWGIWVESVKSLNMPGIVRWRVTPRCSV
jgi:hypothetical protein